MGRARYQENKGDILKKLRQNYRAGTVQQKEKKGCQDFVRKEKKCTAKHMKDKPLGDYVPNIYEPLESSQKNKKQRKEAAAKKQREKKPATATTSQQQQGFRAGGFQEQRGKAWACVVRAFC